MHLRLSSHVKKTLAQDLSYCYKTNKMKPLAIVLIVIGAIMMIITGVNIATKKEVVDLGKVEINKTENHPISC